jgi:hypothetical protein
MSLLSIAEVFGSSVTNNSAEARRRREQKLCPFRQDRCNKGNLKDPLGICSFTNGQMAGVVCPNRFLESGRIFTDVGRIAFGAGERVLVAPEIRILRVGDGKGRRIGKVDYIIAKLDSFQQVCDFAALEVQAVYFSGSSIKPSFHEFLATSKLPATSDRRLDYRSSAQKRLMPQLNLKVPVFRRWGKRFFVAVDSLFFSSLPKFKAVASIENSEITWLVYEFQRDDKGFIMQAPRLVFTLWEDVLTALREGQEPTPSEIMAEIAAKQNKLKAFTT